MNKGLTVGVVILNISILAVSLLNTLVISNTNSKLTKLDGMQKTLNRVDKSVVNPAYAGEDAKNIPNDSTIYMQQVTQEYLLYQLCYGNPMHAFTNAQPFTSNQKCPTLN